MADEPLGDLIYDLLHAIVLDDEVEMEQASLALAKATAKLVEAGRIDGSPTLPAKLKRLRTRLKQALSARGVPDDEDEDDEADADPFNLTPKKRAKRKSRDDDDDLPSVEDL